MMAEVNAGALADSQLMAQQLQIAHDQSAAAKQELERKNRFLGMIMEFLPVSLAIRDAKTRQFTLVNRSVGTDMSAADYLGKTFFELLPEAKARELTALDDQMVDNPSKTISNEFFVNKADGRHMIHQHLRSVRYMSGCYGSDCGGRTDPTVGLSGRADWSAQPFPIRRLPQGGSCGISERGNLLGHSLSGSQ